MTRVKELIRIIISVHLTLVVISNAAFVSNNVGRFWHVTDFHYDLTYNTTKRTCKSQTPLPSGETSGPDPSQPDYDAYGSYYCDSPWLLVEDSIASMADIRSDVDFLIWTGDTVPHIQDEELSLDTNLMILQNVTSALSRYFPTQPVYASLGNHDFYPSDQANVTSSEIYDQVALMWDSWLADRIQIDKFEEGGFYTKLVQPRFRLLALNTNLYYRKNKITENMEDPAGQFAWLEQELNNARENGEKVLITAHIPPGRRTPHLEDHFYLDHKKKMIDILVNNFDVIEATHYGHEHADGFKILQDKNGTKRVTQFTARSVQPWRKDLTADNGDRFRAFHNPGIRLIEYDRNTGKQMDYHQYFVNISETRRTGRYSWVKEYSFREAYGVDDMNAESLAAIFTKMALEGGEEYSSLYCQYAWVGEQGRLCTEEMRANIYCGGLDQNLTSVQECVADFKSGELQKTLRELNKGDDASAISINFYGFLLILSVGIFFTEP